MQQIQVKNNLTSAFDLADDRAYIAWREQKIANSPKNLDDLMVGIDNPHSLNDAEITAIRRACSRANMAIYSCHSEDANRSGNADKTIVTDLGHYFGLRSLDNNLYANDEGISELQVSAEHRQFEYIPYSNKAISWHTDGYYNSPDRKIRTMVLHCVRPAAQGGENALMDHEMLYMLMRDANPQYIEALMQPDVMTIPANIENGVEIRPAQTGSVFSVDHSVDDQSGHLHMRYTARTRSIEWKQDQITLSAVKCLEGILASDSPYIFHHRLSAGQGLICNNVLHTRSAFEDQEGCLGRLVYRARFFERIN
jgi:alpha-ketoglutarate-dependent taurine dioxygenase